MTLIPLWQLVLAGAIQVVTIIWFLAKLNNRVSNLETQAQLSAPFLQRLTRLETLVERVPAMESKLDFIIERNARTDEERTGRR